MGTVASASGPGPAKETPVEKKRNEEVVQSKAEVARLAAEANRKTVTKARADLAQAKADAKTARQKKDTAATIATEARKTSQNPGQTPAEAKRSKEDSNTAAKNLEAATERSTVADKKLQEAEETAAVSAKGAEAAMRKANALAVEESKAPPYSQKDIDKVKPTKNELSSAFEGTSRKAELEKLLGMTPSPPRDIARKPERGESPPPHLDAVDAQDAKAATRMVGERGTYLDRSSGTTYQVRKNATTGETLLSDAASGSSVTIKPDGSYTSTVTSKESTKSGGTRETTWTRSSDAKGQPTGLESRKSQTEQQGETGATTTSSTMTYDTSRSPPRPLTRTEEARMERPPASLASQKGMPQGPATVRTETQFNAQGLPTKQVKTTQVQTPGFRAGDVDAFESGQATALRNASKGEDHHRTNNAPTALKPGESSLTITEETRFNGQGEPAVSTKKTESVATQALPMDKNGNGVQVVRSQQEVTRGHRDAASTDALPALTPKTPGAITERTTVTGYDPDGSGFGEGHASRSRAVSQASGTVDALGQKQMKHQPREVQSLQEASDNRWRYDHVALDVGADGKVAEGTEPRQLDKERQLPWYEDATEFAGDELKALADTAGDAVDGAFDVVTAPLEDALTNEVKKLNSAGDSVSLSGNLDVKVGLKGGISGEAAIERTEDGKYQLSAEVTADVGVGVLGSASVGAGGRMEWKLDTPEEAAKAALILAKGPSAMIPGSEDAKFLKDHLSAVEVNVNGEVEGGVNFKVGSGNVDLSASLGAASGMRVEFDKGKPTHLVKTVEFEGSGAAGVATGLKGKADLNVGGEVSGSVSIETKTPLDASKLDGTDVLSFLTGAKSDALAGPSETSITVEGSVDKGSEGHYFTAEVDRLSDKDVQSVTDKLKAGKFENAFDDLNKKAKVTQGTFKDREAGLGAKLVVVDFELNARHRDLTAEGGGGGNGSTTVSLGSGKRRGNSDGPSGGTGATGGPNRSTGNEAMGGAGPSSKGPGKTLAERNGQPGSTDGAGPSSRPPGNTTTNLDPPTQYRVNPATGQFMPVPPKGGGPSQAGQSKKPGTPGASAEIGPPSKEAQDEKSPTSGHRAVPVVRNPALPGRTTHVRYDDGKVRIEAGPDATPDDIQAHLETARTLQKYDGPLGRVRQLKERINQSLTGRPRYGTQGFESQLEVKKLKSILTELEGVQQRIDDRIHATSGRPDAATVVEHAALEKMISNVEEQLRLHETQVGSLDSGRGFVAKFDNHTERVFPGLVGELKLIESGLGALRPQESPLTKLIDHAADLQSIGRLEGMDDWLRTTASQAQTREQLVERMAELNRAAQAVAALPPSHRVRLDPTSGLGPFNVKLESATPARTPGAVEQRQREGYATPEEREAFDVVVSRMASITSDLEKRLQGLPDKVRNKFVEDTRLNIKDLRESNKVRHTENLLDPLNPQLANVDKKGDITVHYESAPPAAEEVLQAQQLAAARKEEVHLFGDDAAGRSYPGIDGTIGNPRRPMQLKYVPAIGHESTARAMAQHALVHAQRTGMKDVEVYIQVDGKLRAQIAAAWNGPLQGYDPPPIGPVFNSNAVKRIEIQAADGRMEVVIDPATETYSFNNLGRSS